MYTNKNFKKIKSDMFQKTTTQHYLMETEMTALVAFPVCYNPGTFPFFILIHNAAKNNTVLLLLVFISDLRETFSEGIRDEPGRKGQCCRYCLSHEPHERRVQRWRPQEADCTPRDHAVPEQGTGLQPTCWPVHQHTT